MKKGDRCGCKMCCTWTIGLFRYAAIPVQTLAAAS